MGKEQTTKKHKEKLSHRLAHLVSDHVSTPLINMAQYRTFENPQKHKKTIDRQMHRLFRRAGTSIGSDFGTSALFLAQGTVGVVAEHAAIPLAFLPLIGHHIPNSIPLPVDLHIHLTVPFADSSVAQAYNRLPLPNIPKRFDHDGNQWPLFLSTVVTAGLVNIPNAYHAWKEKRPVKRLWYSLSSVLAPSHLPLIFNTFWGELATKAPQKHAEEAFSEKVAHVLSHMPIDHHKEGTDVKKSKWSVVNAFRKRIDRFEEVTSGDIHIDPGERDIFVQAVENRFSGRKNREWWKKRLSHNAVHTVEDKHFGIQHQAERVTHHDQALAHNPNTIGKLYHKAWRRFHSHAQERAEEKLEAIHTVQHFMALTNPKQA